MEPEATAERRAELLIEAKSQVRLPVQYFDVTFSVSKSITLLHASAMANAVQAETGNDSKAAAYWRQAAADVWACIEEGNQAALDYLQREAGYTRSGYHGRQANGITTGRWEDAHAFIAGSFPQHTSRDGDPQLHIHNLVLNRVQRERDQAWRTLDSKALYEHRGAAAAIAALVMESAISRRFGTGWTPRPDGHGREVTGTSPALMDQFSSRRQSIEALTQRLAQRFEEQHGHAPDTRALGKLRQWANHATRLGKGAEPLNLDEEVRRWAAQARATETSALEPLMPAVTTRRGPHPQPEPEPRPLCELTREQEHEVITVALATLQESAPTWRKADLIRYLGELLPANTVCRGTRSAAALLEQLAVRVLAGAAGEHVVTLTAPEWPVVPDELRRADGESVYRPHDRIRYATRAQLSLEERLIAQAQQRGAPRLTPEQTAQLLGADQAQLEALLGSAAPVGEAAEQITGSGLRLDQAAAAYAVLTSNRRTEILVGPAGAGKTRTAAAIASIWQQAGIGDVHGLAVSQAARNVLSEAGVGTASNTAEFLGHVRGRREARGPRPLAPRTLLIIDEASTIPIADLAAIVRHAAATNSRILLTGDHEQLTAVEGGGAMTMLARQLGYAQLAEPVRFANSWERDATLRLRSGDASALADYHDHGRLRGGDPEEAADLACRAYVADYLAGRDVLLLARTADQARELSRRIRDDLIRYRLVNPAVRIPLSHHATASPGDLIMARRNNRTITAGTPGRWLANRDILRIDHAGPRTVTVRRMTGRHHDTGQPAWTPPFEVPRTYVFSHCDLAYATTVHAAQGRTVEVAHALIDGPGTRQWLYVAMSRGWRANYAYCVTGYPNHADPQPGTRPAPELARARRLETEFTGRQQPPPASHPTGSTDERRDEIAVLADVLRSDGTVLSATETLHTELSNADHLGALGAIWYDQTRRAQATLYTAALRNALPDALADEALADRACTWLWRSLRHAEATGLDGPGVLRQVIAARSLTGARKIARVLDSRVRKLVGHRPPARQGTWTSRTPATGSPDLTRYLTELAQAMDDRTRRIGEHATAIRPTWAVQALGDLPADPGAQADWQERAARIGAYRELYGHDSQADPIGPAPALTSPEAWADWHTAFTALTKISGIDLRDIPDSQLNVRRAQYERELAWAPHHVAEELRLARLQARTAWENTTRASRAARTATDPDTRDRHQNLATIWEAMHDQATTLAGQLAEAQETRRQWATITEPTRRMAMAADLELRRRHPEAELAPLTGTPRTGPGSAAEPATPPRATSPVKRARHTVFEQQLSGGDTEISGDAAEHVARIVDNARRAQEQINYLRGQPEYAEHNDAIYLGLAWDVRAGRERDAIIQPPRPDLAPADAVRERSHTRTAVSETELEAG